MYKIYHLRSITPDTTRAPESSLTVSLTPHTDSAHWSVYLSLHEVKVNVNVYIPCSSTDKVPLQRPHRWWHACILGQTAWKEDCTLTLHTNLLSCLLIHQSNTWVFFSVGWPILEPIYRNWISARMPWVGSFYKISSEETKEIYIFRIHVELRKEQWLTWQVVCQHVDCARFLMQCLYC